MGAPPRRIESQVAGAPQYEDGVFHNVLPSIQLAPGSGPSLLKGMMTRRDKGKPNGPGPPDRRGDPGRGRRSGPSPGSDTPAL